MSWVASVVGNILLFALVFGMSATTDIRCIQAQARNVRALSLGIFCQFVVLPFLGFVVVKYLALDKALGLTLLVVTSSPGGSYSNWWCSMFNGDLALSVTMTAVSTCLSMFMLPANLLLYTRFSYQGDVVEALDWPALFTSLAIVISAIALGLFTTAKINNLKFQYAANQLGNFSGLMLIIFSATMTNSGDADSKIWSREWSFYSAVAAPCLGGLILASILATAFRLPKPERVTVAIECCYQNVGIATSLALTMFRGNDLNEAMGVPFFYGLVEAVFVGLYCVLAWKAGWTKAPADENICTVINTSYEVLEIEHGLREVNGIEIVECKEGREDEQEGDTYTTYVLWGGALESRRNIFARASALIGRSMKSFRGNGIADPADSTEPQKASVLPKTESIPEGEEYESGDMRKSSKSDAKHRAGQGEQQV